MVSTLEPICAEISGGSPDIASTANISTAGRDQGSLPFHIQSILFFNQQMNIAFEFCFHTKTKGKIYLPPMHWREISFPSLQCLP